MQNDDYSPRPNPPCSVGRLAQRWGLTDGRSVEQTEADLKALLPEAQWRDVHLQIIYFGAGPSRPKCFAIIRLRVVTCATATTRVVPPRPSLLGTLPTHTWQ